MRRKDLANPKDSQEHCNNGPPAVKMKIKKEKEKEKFSCHFLSLIIVSQLHPNKNLMNQS